MLLVVSGKARSGKDTFSKFLAKALYEKTHKVYYLVAYATSLKRELQNRFDLSYDQLWGDLKEIEDKRYPKSKEDGEIIEGLFWTPREMMQFYGQSIRTLDSNYWVNTLFETLGDKLYKNVIITDGRHRNEIMSVLDLGGFHIRVDRSFDDSLVVHGMDHVSETAAFQEDIPVDIVIKNYGDLDELEKNAYSVADQLISFTKLKENKVNG